MKPNKLKKRIVQGWEDGRTVPIGQVRRRILGIPYWDSLIVFESWYEGGHEVGGGGSGQSKHLRS